MAQYLLKFTEIKNDDYSNDGIAISVVSEETQQLALERYEEGKAIEEVIIDIESPVYSEEEFKEALNDAFNEIHKKRKEAVFIFEDAAYLIKKCINNSLCDTDNSRYDVSDYEFEYDDYLDKTYSKIDNGRDYISSEDDYN